MKKSFALVLLLFSLGFGTFVVRGAAEGVPPNAEEAAVRVPIDLYFKAQATGNGDYIRQAFHADAKVFSIYEGKPSILTRDEFAARFKGQPAPDEARRKRTVERLDITGNAATAKLVLEYPTMKFTDYLSLLKIDGEWKIVSKTFQAEPKQPS